MTLRTRTTLAILFLVAAMSFIAWAVSARLVIRPFARQVGEALDMQAAYVGEQLDDGVHERRLERALGIEIQPAREAQGRLTLIRGRRVWHARRVIVVETERGLVRITRDLDTERPARRLPLLLLFPALLVILLALWIAARTLAPLERASEAMRRVAGGDLEHRLPLEGSKESRQAAESFNAMTDRVVQMLTHERELLAGLSHELRTPLTRLQLELALLEDLIPAHRMQALQGELAELDGLVGEALQLSRLQLGDRTLQRTSVDLAALARSRPGTHTVSGAGVVHADERLLARALDNLLSNAAKYAPGPVEVHVHHEGFSVRDAGPGVSEDDLSRLFTPFYRTHADVRGLGLGLMIVRQVVELHGGTVRAHNTHPGLEVQVTLLPSHALPG